MKNIITKTLLTTVGLAALSACSASSSGGGDDGSGADKQDGVMAEIMCEEFVKDRLKAPATADFSEQQNRKLGDQRWDVTGKVDSENSFGAKIRSSYRCDLKYVGNDKWRAKTVKVD